MFFHSLIFRFSHKQMFILSNIDLLILPTLFSAGFINLIVGWLTKFSVWSSKVIKQILALLIFILSNISTRLAYSILSLFIMSSTPFVDFLYIAVTVLTKRLAPKKHPVYSNNKAWQKELPTQNLSRN